MMSGRICWRTFFHQGEDGIRAVSQKSCLFSYFCVDSLRLATYEELSSEQRFICFQLPVELLLFVSCGCPKFVCFLL